MKETLKTGLETAHSFVVDESRVTRHLGGMPGVYATPFLIRDVEHVCHELLQAHVEDGEDSVGTRIDIRHLAPTLEGMQVTVAAKITAIDGRAVDFDVSVRDEQEELARGTHSRFVVDKDRLQQRLETKAAKIRGG